MRPLLYAAVIIALILFIGIYTINMLERDAEALHDYILEMEKWINNEKWDKVDEVSTKFNDQWEKNKKIWPILIDHLEIDNINIHLAELESFMESKDKAQSLSELSVLKLLVKHIPEKESFIMQNIL